MPGLPGNRISFNLEEVLNGISEKLISRHPHIYGDVKVNSEDDVKQKLGKTQTPGREKICFERCTCFTAGRGKGNPSAGKIQTGGF